MLHNSKVLGQKEASSYRVLTPGKPHPGSHTLHWAPIHGVGCIGWSQKSGALSPQPGAPWPPEVSGADTHSVCPSRQAVFMLNKFWCQSQLDYGSKKLLPCCTSLGVLRTCSKGHGSPKSLKSKPVTILVAFFHSDSSGGL